MSAARKRPQPRASAVSAPRPKPAPGAIGTRGDQDPARISEHRDSWLFETLALGVVLQRPDGAITAANPAARRILGLPFDLTRGPDATDPHRRAIRVDGSDFPAAEHPAMVALHTGREVRDVVMGIFNPVLEAWSWLSVTAVPRFSDGDRQPCEVCTYFEEITERKRVEDALRESEERYQRITAGLTDYLYTVKVRDGRALATVHGQACEVVTGYTREEFAADPYLWIRMVVPEDRDRVIGHVALILTGQKVPPIEHRIAHRDGKVRWVRDTTIPHLDADGRLVSYDGVVNDITARKESEQALMQAQKLESLGMLAGGIAHDFNNLLMAMMGNLDLALLNLDPQSEAHPRIEKALQSAWRAAELAGQMLAYSGQGQFVIRDLDISALVLENAHLLRAVVPRTVELDLRLGREPLLVRADVAQVQQVVMNLITNAAEAIGHNPGVVAIATGAGDFDREYLARSVIEQKPPPGRYVWLEVIDTGSGMDEQTRERMFDPFFSTKFVGRGLGLSAMHGIVKAHGGAILVATRPGQGTTMRVLLPEARAQTPCEGAADSPAAALSAPETVDRRLTGTVLLVDDEEPVRGVCAAMLEQLGLQVLVAADGEDAVQAFRKHSRRIDAVILDLTMPRMDGIAAFDAMRRDAPGVKVILASGYGEQELISRFADRGLAGFIRKPYVLEGLRSVLRRVL